ncbi:MAG TPA: decaprenyl-phosphate phosphoribosyltransferase [Thermoanaerobaculia bacterium]|nr:decaprenyl-phosphate phosphoribosyltransferase [Thermoanaerobaculia bacterium]
MIRPLLVSLRPLQWAKNLFVLAPLVFGHLLGDPAAVGRALLALIAFCCAASTIYLINDVRDREEDRNHPLKRLRPLAAGTLAVPVAIAAAAVLGGAALTLAVFLGRPFLVTLGIYMGLSLLYTHWFKHMVILDVMCISLGFVLRVLAGAAATNVQVSRWLFLCTIFLALFLAFSKRRHEITLLAGAASGQRKVLDHYSPAFLDQMINVVTASSVVAYALYSVAPETVAKYNTQDLVYTIPLVLYGIFRYLYLMYQSPGERNPTEAILRDPPFLINMVLWGLAVIWIVYGGGLGGILGG